MKTQFEKNKAMQYSSVSELLEEVEELTVVRIISSRKATPLNKKKIEKVSELDEMLPEYDFTGQKGVRGKYSQAYRQGHTVKIHRPDGSVSTQYLTLEDGAVMLEPDLRGWHIGR